MAVNNNNYGFGIRQVRLIGDKLIDLEEFKKDEDLLEEEQQEELEEQQRRMMQQQQAMNGPNDLKNGKSPNGKNSSTQQ